MNPLRTARETSRSPRIDDSDTDAHGSHLAAPQPHTDAELAALLGLLTGHKPQIRAVAIGHSRHEASRTTARAFADVWKTRGGTVLTVVDWPETAASWLRPATRLTAETPDAWVIAAGVLGFAQLARRLRHSTGWDPARTFAFSALNDPRLTALAGPDTLHGLRGATAAGDTWDVRNGWVATYTPAGRTT